MATMRQARAAARREARRYYVDDVAGNGVHDWQSAEYGAFQALLDAGQPNNDMTYELARDIAADVTEEVDAEDAEKQDAEARASHVADDHEEQDEVEPVLTMRKFK